MRVTKGHSNLYSLHVLELQYYRRCSKNFVTDCTFAHANNFVADCCTFAHADNFVADCTFVHANNFVADCTFVHALYIALYIYSSHRHVSVWICRRNYFLKIYSISFLFMCYN